MIQYLFQSMNFRGDATPYRDLIHAVAVEEISHVELIGTTIARLLDDAPRFKGRKDAPAHGGSTPLETAIGRGQANGIHNIHHFLVGAQGAMPVDSVGNPWSGSYVYNSGNLVLDLMYNLMLEATGRLQKSRLYEMSDNAAFRGTVAYLIVRDHAHELAFAKALETLGANWGKVLPIPNYDAFAYPEVRVLMEQGLHLQQHHWRLDGSELGKNFQGSSPANNDEELSVLDAPPLGFPIETGAERPEEYAPGLTPELEELADAIKRMSALRQISSFDDVKRCASGEFLVFGHGLVCSLGHKIQPTKNRVPTTCDLAR